MTHDDVIRALAHAYPGSEWSYDGDGSTLDRVVENDVLVSRGLEWHDDSQPPPTLADLEAVLPDVAPPPPPLDERLATALAALPQDEPVTRSQLTHLVALLSGSDPDELVAKVEATNPRRRRR